MTLIAGYIYSDTIHVVADSAVTILNDIMNETQKKNEDFNSFGEVIEFNDGSVITESANKVYSLNNSILITYSGQTEEGKRLLEDLRMEISISEKKELTEILSDFFLRRAPRLTQFIIGFIQNNNPTIFSYANEIKIITQNGSFLLLGSGSEDELLTHSFKILFKQLCRSNLSSDNFLTIILSVLQSCVLNARTFTKGVGGFFNGAYIHTNGIYWAKDTCMILYSSNFFEKSERFL